MTQPRRDGHTSRLSVALLAVGLGGCAATPSIVKPQLVAHTSAAFDVEASLFLIGDAGKTTPQDPVLVALGKAVRRAHHPARVVFLGDNIYEHGLPGKDTSEALARLSSQIGAVDRGTPLTFVPGNHDWDRSGEDGWASICRLGNHLAQQAVAQKRDVTLSPKGGCPGPVVDDSLAAGVRLVFLDTQWWIHPHDKPGPGAEPPPACPVADLTCPAVTEMGVLASLRDAIRSAGARKVVVMAHHPLESAGAHGSGHALDDLCGDRYTIMRQQVGAIVQETGALVYAAGHDHSLQVLKQVTQQYVLVSGAGSVSKATNVSESVTSCDEASGAPKPKIVCPTYSGSGFMRLDFVKGGGVFLEVTKAEKPAQAICQEWLVHPTK